MNRQRLVQAHAEAAAGSPCVARRAFAFGKILSDRSKKQALQQRRMLLEKYDGLCLTFNTTTNLHCFV